MDKNTAATYGYEFNIDKGIYLLKIGKNTPAAKAGMHEGDIIIKVAGTDINSVADLRGAVDAQTVGSKVDVVIIRGGKEQTTSVLLEEMPSQQ